MTLFYAMRTFRHLDVLPKGTVVLHRPKLDTAALVQRILHEKPERIIGLGNASTTHFVTTVVNTLHTRHVVIPGAPDTYALSVPRSGIASSAITTDSFCNWTAFYIAHYCAQYQLPTRHSFLHVAANDATVLLQELQHTA